MNPVVLLTRNPTFSNPLGRLIRGFLLLFYITLSLQISLFLTFPLLLLLPYIFVLLLTFITCKKKKGKKGGYRSSQQPQHNLKPTLNSFSFFLSWSLLSLLDKESRKETLEIHSTTPVVHVLLLLRNVFSLFQNFFPTFQYILDGLCQLL